MGVERRVETYAAGGEGARGDGRPEAVDAPRWDAEGSGG